VIDSAEKICLALDLAIVALCATFLAQRGSSAVAIESGGVYTRPATERRRSKPAGPNPPLPPATSQPEQYQAEHLLLDLSSYHTRNHILMAGAEPTSPDAVKTAASLALLAIMYVAHRPAA